LKIKYRSDIDGLRAIAVIAVIFYHNQITLFGFKFLSGGFLGVDIFFVISGYLITRIILLELSENNQFSFKSFYLRRCRRILPALIFVILLSIPFAYILLLPVSLIDFSKSVLFTLGFTSNLYFYNSGNEYQAVDSILKPFLHTWSLSIEEQFYIIFPLFLFFIFKIYKKKIFLIIFILFTISIISSNYFSYNYKELNFFFFPSRIWELLSGSLVACIQIFYRNNNSNYYKYFNKLKSFNIFSILGFFLITYSLIFYNDKIAHPSFFTLVPIIGTCLILIFYNNKLLLSKFLSFRPLRFIGLISYSLYLIHYPVLSFFNIEGYTHNTLHIKLFLMFFVATASYYLIEIPFRNFSKINNKNFIYIMLFFFILIFILCSYVIFKNGKVNEKNVKISLAIESNYYDNGLCKFSTINLNVVKNSKENFISRLEQCLIKNNLPFILVLGDSHSENLYNSLAQFSNYPFIVGINTPGCSVPSKKEFENVEFGHQKRERESCFYYQALDFINKYKENIRVILFHNKGSYYLTDSSLGKKPGKSEYRQLPIISDEIDRNIYYLKKIKNIFEQTIFVGPFMEPNIKIDRHVFNKLDPRSLESNVNLSIINVDNELEIASKINNIQYISSIKILSYDPINDFYKDGYFMYKDTDHWSMHGEKYFGKKLFSDKKLIKFLE
jgi:peptidoglycan/LPS O-acetylase OafA/YrhL